MRFAWDDLRYLPAFARAAKALRVHQSTIQRRIAELEESLGRRLVEPHGGGYRLTELGQELQSKPGCRPGLSLLSSWRAPLVL
jgi:DNA-binding transcriptional LysR family regulator